jgi:hypothetical protein
MEEPLAEAEKNGTIPDTQVAPAVPVTDAGHFTQAICRPRLAVKTMQTIGTDLRK